MDIPVLIARPTSTSMLMKSGTASDADRYRTDWRVRFRRQASIAMGMGPTSASSAAPQARGRHVHSARAGGTRSNG